MEGSDLKRESASDPNFMRTLERAIRIGEPVLLEVRKVVVDDEDPKVSIVLD